MVGSHMDFRNKIQNKESREMASGEKEKQNDPGKDGQNKQWRI